MASNQKSINQGNYASIGAGTRDGRIRVDNWRGKSKQLPNVIFMSTRYQDIVFNAIQDAASLVRLVKSLIKQRTKS